ncbi:MAG: hypothetical protein K2P94_11925 [Rhodospirillaceae bacterium]|nr:hypothetical protein [Rhodospirillaceae bacterium]
MISLLKIIFTIAVVYGVWFAFKYRARIVAAHKVVMDEKKRAATAEAASRTPGTPLAQDLAPCPKCGSYIAAGTRCSCEKA